MRELLDITAKDLRLLWRDPPALLFLVFVPMVVVGIIAATLASQEGGGSIRLPVVDEDQGPVATLLVEALSKHVEVEVVDRERARELVAEDNVAAAALLIPEGTSKRYLASRPSTLTLVTDPAKSYEVGTVKAWMLVADKEATSLADPFFEELLVLEEVSATGSRLRIPPYEQNVPGFGVMFVLIGVLFGVGFGLRDEVEWGTLTRLRGAPLAPATILGGKLLARFSVGVAQLWILFLFGRVVFGMSLGAHPWTLLPVSLAIVLAMTGFSLLVASFTRSREQVVPLCLTVVLIVCSTGGCWWPLYDMPDWLGTGARAFFTPWAMDAILDVIFRDRGLADVAGTLGILTAYGLATAALGIRLTRLT